MNLSREIFKLTLFPLSGTFTKSIDSSPGTGTEDAITNINPSKAIDSFILIWFLFSLNTNFKC